MSASKSEYLDIYAADIFSQKSPTHMRRLKKAVSGADFLIKCRDNELVSNHIHCLTKGEVDYLAMHLVACIREYKARGASIVQVRV